MITFEELIIEDKSYLSNPNLRFSRIIDEDGLYTKYIVVSDGSILKIDKYRLKKPKLQRTKTNYLMSQLSIAGKRKGYTIHRLVAQAFIENPDNKPQVNHIDGNKLNNHIDNLEWCTASENIVHAYETGLHKISYGEESNNPKVTKKQVKRICELLEENVCTLDEIANDVGTTRVIVYNIKHKLAWLSISKYYKVDNHTVRSDGTVRLTEPVVHDICTELEKNELTTKQISEKYETSYESVSCIKQRKTWKHVSKDYNVENHTIRHNVNKKNMKKIKKICELLQDTEMTVLEISRTLDVPWPLIYRILNKSSWKHISKDYNFSNRINTQ